MRSAPRIKVEPRKAPVGFSSLEARRLSCERNEDEAAVRGFVIWRIDMHEENQSQRCWKSGTPSPM